MPECPNCGYCFFNCVICGEERCIKAATPEAGCCAGCRKPWVRIVKKDLAAHDGDTKGGKNDNTRRIALLRQAARKRGEEYTSQSVTVGWEPACDCNVPSVPSIIV